MKRSSIFLISFLLIFSFNFTKAYAQDGKKQLWKTYDETSEIQNQQDHANPRMRYKLIQSKFLDKNEVFQKLAPQVSKFSEKRYNQLKPYIIEKNIPSIQQSISEGIFTYEELTLFYLKRIFKYELDKDKSLHTIIALTLIFLNKHEIEIKTKKQIII